MNNPSHALLTFTAILFCTCAAAAAAHPAGQPQELRGLLSHLLNNVLKTGSEDVSEADHWPVANDDQTEDVAEHSQALVSRPVATSGDKLSALKQGFLGFNKRYYDYGLGGGRFGKRYYGDYGIGGGRFGRDVDHVDIGDANDVTQ